MPAPMAAPSSKNDPLDIGLAFHNLRLLDLCVLTAKIIPAAAVAGKARRRHGTAFLLSQLIIARSGEAAGVS